MVRYRFIEQQVLDIYLDLPIISFPINPIEIIKTMSNCRYASYQECMRIAGCSIEDIIKMCSSKSGCTHYDVEKNEYLVLCNESLDGHNTLSRQLWTCSHELGHIKCKHHLISAYSALSEHGTKQPVNNDYEHEADFFAATLLAPFPFFKLLNIKSPIDIQNVFGLSCEASLYRYKKYLKWRSQRIKTSWENDMTKIFRQKYSVT